MAPSNKRAMLIIFVTVFIDLLGFGIVLPLLPRYGDRLHASPTMLGMLMASFSAMQFIFTPIWGRISDRVGRRPILLMGLAGTMAFYLLFGFASTWESLPLLFVARIGAGIAGATIATAQAYIADITPPEGRSKGMALIGAAFGIGFTFGPLLGAAVVGGPPPKLGAKIAADSRAPELGVLVPDAAGVPVVELPYLSPLPGFLAAGMSGLALLVAWAILPESLSESSRASRQDWFHGSNLRMALAAPSVIRLILVFFVATFAFAMFESTLSLVNLRVFNMTDQQNFYLFAFIGFTLIIAQGFVVRRLSGRLADESMTSLGVALLLLGMLGMTVTLTSRSFGLLVLLLVVLVHGFALTTTSLQSLISRRSRADQQGGILGVNQAGSALARILGPFVGISLFGDAAAQSMVRGPTAPYVLGCGILMLAGSIWWSMERGRPADEPNSRSP